MTNAELIECLRCENENYGDCSLYESDCKYRVGIYCAYRQMMYDAADEIEAADNRIAELETQAAFFDAEKLNYQENIEYRDERIKELEAQMPKEGEWFKYNNPNYSPFDDSGEYLYQCNKCGKVVIQETNYCPNCGARMKGEWGK